MKAGRSGTTASSSSRVGRPPGKGAYSQPRPRTHGAPGVWPACAADRGQDGVDGLERVELGVVELAGAAPEVDVGVVEAGEDQAAAGVDGLAGVAAGGPDLVVRADMGDPPAARIRTAVRRRRRRARAR